MALIHSLESHGNILFKYRGQIPLILFVVSIPFIYFTDYTWINGYPWLENIMLYCCIGLSVIGLIIRSYTIGTTPKGTSGRNTENQVAEVLNSTGIYSVVRHPLYLGNYFMWLGITAFSFNIYFVVIMTLAYWLYYERIMFAEERFLERKFGKDYLDWSLNAPAFFPSFKNFKKSVVPFSMKVVLRREYSGVMATVVGFVFVAVFRDYFISGVLEFNMNYLIVLGVFLFITLFLRTLKHRTRLLHEEGRS